MRYERFDMYSEELMRTIEAYILLPKEYHLTDRQYPVLYMHDAHNLFDDGTATYGKSWGIEKSFDDNPDLPAVIIAGFNCAQGPVRLDEYSPWENSQIMALHPEIADRTVGGMGDVYLDYLTNTFKKEIESRYRVDNNPDLTGMAGSSMGGLISIYAACTRSDVFRRFAAFSNAFWFAQSQIEECIESADLGSVVRLYMDTGTKENRDEEEWNLLYLESNRDVDRIISKKLSGDIYMYVEADGAVHSEECWEKRFPDMLRFLYGR